MDQQPFAPPSPRDRIDKPLAAREPGTARRQPPTLARAGIGLVVGAALVVAAFGGVVFGGRPTGAVRTPRVAASLPSPGGTPPEYQVIEEPSPPPVPEPALTAEPEPPPPPAPRPSGRFAVEQIALDLSYDG